MAKIEASLDTDTLALIDNLVKDGVGSDREEVIQKALDIL